MRMSLNPEDLAIETAVIGPAPEESYVDSQVWYTNTRPMPAATNSPGCTIA